MPPPIAQGNLTVKYISINITKSLQSLNIDELSGQCKYRVTDSGNSGMTIFSSFDDRLSF
jgi:hypothetical protein